MEFRQYFVAGMTDESPDVRTFRLAPKEGGIPAYRPGHFFLLRLKGQDGKYVQRSYSVASHPEEEGLAFCIKLKGIFTHLLWDLKKGDGIEADGPYGIFLLLPDDAERVFIGGGVGISALRPMILQTIKEGKPASLFHSARTAEHLTYFAEMKKLAGETRLFRFYHSISGEQLPDGWDGLVGRISVQLLKEKLGSFPGKSFYLCGSKEMAGSLAAGLIAEGVPKERVKKDEWV